MLDILQTIKSNPFTFYIFIQISLNCIRKGPNDIKSPLSRVMAWCCTGSTISLAQLGDVDTWLMSHNIHKMAMQFTKRLFANINNHALFNCRKLE